MKERDPDEIPNPKEIPNRPNPGKDYPAKAPNEEPDNHDSSKPLKPE